MKKLIYSICTSILLIVILIGNTYANIDVHLKSPIMVAKDEEFEITIESNMEMLGIGFTLNYDKELLQFIKIEGPEDGINVVNSSNEGEIKGVFTSLEQYKKPYKIIFKALKNNKTATIKVSKLDITIKDENAEYGMKQETDIKVDDLKVKLVKKSELSDENNMKLTNRMNSSYISYIIVGTLIISLIIILLFVLNKNKSK